MEYPYKKRDERRRGKDPLLAIMPWISGIGWLVLVVALFLTASAQPETETLIERWHQKEVDSDWNLQRLHWTFRLCIVSFGISLLGLVVNSRRLKRKRDELRVNLLLMGVLSLLGVGFYLLIVFR